jgi:hypothetical protein
MGQWLRLAIVQEVGRFKDRAMDETKNPSEIQGSQSAAVGSGGSQDETKSLSETEGSQALFVGLSESTDGDPPRIGRYRIIRRLGQGGFGRVYLAHDDELDRPVAIKVPNPERIAHPEDVEAYLNAGGGQRPGGQDQPGSPVLPGFGRTGRHRC